MTGTVFNIQHFCLHDGPGIRTGVFLKGCPLRCLWCANPESQSPKTQILWDSGRCTLCGHCVSVCPVKAIRMEADRVITDHGLCTGCGVCAKSCPQKTREVCGRTMTAEEVVQEALEDRIFYGNEGGITLTGGEVLLQSGFAAEIFRLSKEAGITTAMETGGFGTRESLEAVAQYCDTVLYDVKHTEDETHRKLTGQGHGLILDNLQRLSHHFPSLHIRLRVPLIPGCNDGEDNLRRVGQLAKALPRCTGVDLLPYHNLGVGKRSQLGYEAEFTAQVPDGGYMERLRDIVREYVPDVG